MDDLVLEPLTRFEYHVRMHDVSPEEFEKRRSHATKRLVDLAYRQLVEGSPAGKVADDLVHMGVDVETAAFITQYVYKKKRWQIAWQRAGGGARLLFAGLANTAAGAILIAVGLAAARTLGQLYTELSSWLARGLLLVGAIVATSGIVTTLWGGFRLATASSDEAKGCLPAALIGLILLLTGVVGYLLWLLLQV